MTIKKQGIYFPNLKEFHIYNSGSKAWIQDIDNLRKILMLQNKITIGPDKQPYSIITIDEAEALEVKIITHYASPHLRKIAEANPASTKSIWD